MKDSIIPPLKPYLSKVEGKKENNFYWDSLQKNRLQNSL